MRKNQRQLHLSNKSLFLSCIVPVYNEEAVIETFLKALFVSLRQLDYYFEIIVVDDGSSDATIEKLLPLLSEYQIKLIQLSRNFGKEVALSAGLEHCTGEVAILIDADFQHPLELIPQFVSAWGEGYDMVYGVRNNRETDSRSKRRLTYLFYWLMSKMTKIDLPGNAGDFRLLDRKVIYALNQFPERIRFMKGLYAWIGFHKKAIPFTVPKRRAGKSSWGFAQLTELAITGIISFSDVPLRVWGMIGFFISLTSFIYAIYIVTVTLLYGTDLPGFPTLVVAIMFLGGIQLLSIGILGEYIARIFTEVKHRPKYLIAEKYGFDDTL